MPKEFDILKDKIKQQLLKKGISNDEAEKRAYAIAVTNWKNTHDGKLPSDESIKRDEQGRKIIAENVRLNFVSNLSLIE